MRAFPGVVMAVDTTDPQIARMLLVRKRNGLLGRIAFLIAREWVTAEVVCQRDNADSQSRQ